MRRLAACLPLFLLAGCGYRTGFPLPEHLRTFSVNVFRNGTLERNLDFEFTQALIQEIHAKTPLRVARPGKADLEISGELAEFQRHTTSRSRLISNRKYIGGVTEMRYFLYVNVEMYDAAKRAVFFRGDRIARRVDFSLTRGQTSRDAKEELIRELARRVVSLAFEPWPAKTVEAEARGGRAAEPPADEPDE